MPTVISCPQCSTKLKVPDTVLGKNVKCPKCSFAFVAPAATPSPAITKTPAAPPPPPVPQQPRPPAPREDYQDDYQRDDDDEEEYDDRRRRRRKPPGTRNEWAKVRTGVTLVLSGVFTLLATALLSCCAFGVVVGVLAGSVSQAARNRGNVGGALGTSLGLFIAVCVLAGLGVLIMFGLTGVGNIFCIAAPRKKGAKALAITSSALVGATVLLLVISITVVVLSGALAASNRSVQGLQGLLAGSLVGLILYFLSVLAWFSQIITYQFFLRSVSVILQRTGLTSAITWMIGVGGAAILVYILGMAVQLVSGIGAARATAFSRGGSSANDLASTGGALGGLLGGALTCFGAILYLTWFVWYIVTLFMVRGAISARVER